MRRKAAGLEERKKRIMEASIKIQRNTIPTKAKPGFLNPKKSIDQSMLRMSCTEKTIIAMRLTLGPIVFLLFKKKYNEMPIRVQSRDHAGAKSQLGGEKKGFSSKAYQVVIAGAVQIEPMIPGIQQTIIEAINNPISFARMNKKKKEVIKKALTKKLNLFFQPIKNNFK